MKKIVFISSIASPYQIKYCYALQRYFNAEFWFYDFLNFSRPSWWKIDLGNKCKVLKGVLFKRQGRYFTFTVLKELQDFDPDIIMLGGFSIPGNYIAYLWGKRKKKKVIVFTERSRNKEGVLRKKSFAWRLLSFLYKDIDLVIVSAEDAIPQFRDEFGFGNKVVAGRYASDIDDYFQHPIRKPKASYTFLYPNRLIPIYNPLLAIDIFYLILSKYPGSRLLMNAAGELMSKCKEKISLLGIESSVKFLTEINSWNDLHKVYKESDIMILPASFSNGNFTIVEAMASGMGIVISNRVLGIGKLIEDGVNGFNCEPNIEEFEKRIEQYLRNPALFEKHAMINRRKVRPLSLSGTARFFKHLLDEHLFAIE